MASVSSITSQSLAQLLAQANGNGNNAERKLESFGFFLKDYVISGGEVTFSSTNPQSFTVSEMVASLDDGLWRVYEKSFSVKDVNATYFLDFTVSQGFVLSTSHPTTSYKALWTITTDGSGNLATKVDNRGTLGMVQFRDEIQGIVLSDLTTVSESQIANDSVGNTKLKSLSVSESKMADDSVSTRTIQAGAVGLDELSTASKDSANHTYSGSVPGKTTSKTAIDATYDRLIQAIQESGVSEVSDARQDPTDNVTYDTLKARIDKKSEQIGISSKKLTGIKDITEYEPYKVAVTGGYDWYPAFTQAISELQPGEKLKAYGSYLVTQEVLIDKDDVTCDFKGAIFIGPTTGTSAGGLVTVGDRSNMTHIVKNVKVYGGTYIPKNALDNGLNIGQNVDNVLVEGIICDVTIGQRGVAIQNNQAGYSITNVQIRGVLSKGGKDAVNIDGLNNSIIKGISIDGVLAQDCEKAVRVSNGGSSYNNLEGIKVSNILGMNVKTVSEINGVEGEVNELQGIGVTYRAFIFDHCKHIVGNTLKAKSGASMDASSMAIVCNNSCEDIQLSGIQIEGTWDYAIFASTKKSKFEGIIQGTFNTYVINTSSGLIGNTYDLILDTASTLCNSYRDGDRYLFKQYDATGINTYYPKGEGKVRYGTAAPTTGTWSQGDTFVNTTLNIFKNIDRWRCVSGGTPGTWRAFGCGRGTTIQRPALTVSDAGYQYEDTTLNANGKLIYWNGTAWVDTTGATV